MRPFLAEMKLDLSDGQLEQFDIYKDELIKWSKIHNLTTLRAEDEILRLHFLDSLAYLFAIPENSCRIADIGSGAGFPGLPLAIAKPEHAFVLYERSFKKMAFLKHIVRLLDLTHVQVKKGDEKIASSPEGCFNCVVSRALWRPSRLYDHVKNILCENGVIVVSEGRSYESYLNDLPPDMNKRIIPVRVTHDVDRWLIVLISGRLH